MEEPGSYVAEPVGPVMHEEGIEFKTPVAVDSHPFWSGDHPLEKGPFPKRSLLFRALITRHSNRDGWDE